jgi:hypothetical protein
MPPRSSRGRGGQGDRSQAASAADAGPSNSGRDAVPPAMLAALDALADAAPSLLRLQGPSGALPAPLSISALRRLVQQLESAIVEIQQCSVEEQNAAASLLLLLPRFPVTAVLMLSQPSTLGMAPPDEGSQRIGLEAKARLRGATLVVAILARTPHSHVKAIRDVFRSLLRAGVLSFAARNMAQAAAAVEAAAPHRVVPGICVDELYAGYTVVFVAARVASSWPELAPEVEAAFEHSQVLQHAGRLFVLLLTAVAARRGVQGDGDQARWSNLSGLVYMSKSLGSLLRGLGRTPRAAAAVRGWPLHALLVFAVGQLSAGEPPGPTYGLPAELVAAAARPQGGGFFVKDVSTVLFTTAYALSAADVPMHGFSRRGLLTVALGLGQWAIAADAARRAAGEARVEDHSFTAAAAVCAAGNLLRGTALEAEWERQALTDAWRLVRDAAVAGLLLQGCFPGCEMLEYADSLWLLLGLEASEGDGAGSQLTQACLLHVSSAVLLQRSSRIPSPQVHRRDEMCPHPQLSQ